MVLRGCDPLLYQYVDSGENALPRMVSPTNRCWYGISTLSAIAIIMMKEFIRRCERTCAAGSADQRVMRFGGGELDCAHDFGTE